MGHSKRDYLLFCAEVAAELIGIFRCRKQAAGCPKSPDKKWLEPHSCLQKEICVLIVKPSKGM